MIYLRSERKRVGYLSYMVGIKLAWQAKIYETAFVKKQKELQNKRK